MKNFIWVFCCFFFFSCDNEIDINDEWADIPVIYGIFDSGASVDADGSDFATPTPYQPSFLDSTNIDFNFDGDSEDDFNNIHFVRVQKSFLGSSSAYDYTNISDSIYYSNNNQNIDVWVELIDPNWTDDVEPAQVPLQLIDENDLVDMGIVKDDGLFNSDNYYLYKILTYNEAVEWGLNTVPGFADITDLCQGDCDNKIDYKICVLNNLTGDTASAVTNIVEPLNVLMPTSSGVSSILELGLENKPLKIRVYYSRNAKMYSISFRFHYLEQTAEGYNIDQQQNNPLPTTGVVHKYVDWTWNDIVITDSDQLNGAGGFMDISKYGAEFFTFLKSSLSEQNLSQPEFYRYPVNTLSQNFENIVADAGIYHRCIDLNITAVNSELYTYLQANGPNYGFNQERPEYNNIQNGIGHVGARSVLNMKNLRIDQGAADSLSFGQITNKLNFACYSINSIENNFEVQFPPYCE